MNIIEVSILGILIVLSVTVLFLIFLLTEESDK